MIHLGDGVVHTVGVTDAVRYGARGGRRGRPEKREAIHKINLRRNK